jgi:hypothetical protein
MLSNSVGLFERKLHWPSREYSFHLLSYNAVYYPNQRVRPCLKGQSNCGIQLLRLSPPRAQKRMVGEWTGCLKWLPLLLVHRYKICFIGNLWSSWGWWLARIVHNVFWLRGCWGEKWKVKRATLSTQSGGWPTEDLSWTGHRKRKLADNNKEEPQYPRPLS